MQAKCSCYEWHYEDGEIGAVKGDDRRTVPVEGFDMVSALQTSQWSQLLPTTNPGIS